MHATEFERDQLPVFINYYYNGPANKSLLLQNVSHPVCHLSRHRTTMETNLKHSCAIK